LQPKSKRKKRLNDDHKPKRVKSARERVTVWNKVQRRKLSGNAAPLRANLKQYLQQNPVYEVYVDQDTILTPGQNATPPGCMEFTLKAPQQNTTGGRNATPSGCMEFTLNAPQQNTTVFSTRDTEFVEQFHTAPHGMESAEAAYVRALCHDISIASAPAPQPPRAPQRTHAPPQAPPQATPSAPYFSDMTPMEDEAPVGEEEAPINAVAIMQTLIQWLLQSPQSSAAGSIQDFLLGNEGLAVPIRLNSEIKELIEDITESSFCPQSEICHPPVPHQQHAAKKHDDLNRQCDASKQYAGSCQHFDLQDIPLVHWFINQYNVQCHSADQGCHLYDESHVANEANTSERIKAEDSGSLSCGDSTYTSQHVEDAHIEEDCSQNNSEDTLVLNMDEIEIGFEQSCDHLSPCELMQMLPSIC